MYEWCIILAWHAWCSADARTYPVVGLVQWEPPNFSCIIPKHSRSKHVQVPVLFDSVWHEDNAAVPLVSHLHNFLSMSKIFHHSHKKPRNYTMWFIDFDVEMSWKYIPFQNMFHDKLFCVFPQILYMRLFNICNNLVNEHHVGIWQETVYKDGWRKGCLESGVVELWTLCH